MPHPRDQRTTTSDAVAREAARLLVRGRAADLGEARRLAADALDAPSSGRSGGSGGSGRASVKRIRQHAQMMDMQSMGEAAYREQIRAWLELAEDLMSTLEAALPESETLLVGRAAQANFDADPALHIRILAREDIGAIARTLAAYGYEVPDAVFPTTDSRHGRLSQMQWIDEGGIRITLTRCPHRSVFESRGHLVTGKKIERQSLAQLRERLAREKP